VDRNPRAAAPDLDRRLHGDAELEWIPRSRAGDRGLRQQPRRRLGVAAGDRRRLAAAAHAADGHRGQRRGAGTERDHRLGQPGDRHAVAALRDLGGGAVARRGHRAARRRRRPRQPGPGAVPGRRPRRRAPARAGQDPARRGRQQQASTEVEYRRTQALFDQQAATPQQRDRSAAQLDAAKLGVAQAQSGVALASKAVGDATALAPIAGVVVSRRIALGDFVTDGMPALVVQDQAQLDLRFRLPDRALATVRVGDTISVALPALATSRKATISLVAPSVDPRTRTVELTAVLDNRDGALRPGLMADVELDAKLASASTP
jgi:hypothetical protein